MVLRRDLYRLLSDEWNHVQWRNNYTLSFILSANFLFFFLTWNGKKITNWKATSRITYIMLFASTEISSLFSELFLGEKFIVTFLNDDFQFSSTFEDQNLYTSSKTFDMNAKLLLSNIDVEFYSGMHSRRYQINYFGIIYIQSKSVVYQIEFEMLMKHLLEKYKSLEKCFFVYKLNISHQVDITNLMNRIDKDKYLKNLIVIGEPNHQIILFKQYMKMYLTKYIDGPYVSWIFFDLDKDSDLYYTITTPQYAFSFYNEAKKFTTTSHLNNVIASIRIELGTIQQYSIDETTLINKCNQAFGEHVITNGANNQFVREIRSFQILYFWLIQRKLSAKV